MRDNYYYIVEVTHVTGEKERIGTASSPGSPFKSKRPALKVCEAQKQRPSVERVDLIGIEMIESFKDCIYKG